MGWLDANEIVPGLLRTSVQAGVLVLILLVVQWVFRKRLTPRWRCALWLLVAVRLMLPFSFASAASLYNLLPQWLGRTTSPVGVESASPVPVSSSVVSITPSIAPLPGEGSGSGAAVESIPMIDLSAPSDPVSIWRKFSGLSWVQIATWIWLAGMFVLLARVLVSSIRMAYRFGRLPPCGDVKVLRVLKECRERLPVRPHLIVVESTEMSTPAMHGLTRARLLLPKGFAARFSSRELQFIFLHELAHLRRHDLGMNWLVTILQIVHWFNPLVWVAFSRWRAERELACDALALEAAGPEQNREYGRTILRLLDGFTYRPPSPGLVGILEDKRELQQRIQMIARFKSSPRWSALAILLVMTVGAVCLTDAKVREAILEVEEAEPVAMVWAPGTEPLTLDLGKFYHVRAETNAVFASFSGRQLIGGLPFQIDGQAFLSCRSDAQWSGRQLPHAFENIRVDRKFDEIDLIHHTVGSDMRPATVARVRLNYKDGSKHEIPIIYGTHLRDGYRLSTETSERLSDSQSELVWRGPEGSADKPFRLFRTRLRNPYPDRMVAAVDVICTQEEAAYVLVAATVWGRGLMDEVAGADTVATGDVETGVGGVKGEESRDVAAPSRVVLDPVKDFDAKVTIRVMDRMTGEPIEGAIVDTTITVDRENMSVSPLTTPSSGVGEVRYPRSRTAQIWVSVRKPGYTGQTVGWSSNIPDAFTFRLVSAVEENETSDFRALDIERFQKPFTGFSRVLEVFDSIKGRQVIDGLPFQVNGYAVLFGKMYLARESESFPEALNGIRVGRRFDELHLVHCAKWLDMEGVEIGRVRLNYEDGSKHEFPISYGVHVRDWLRQPTEEVEQMGDSGTKVIWRGPGPVEFPMGSARLFKSVLSNPHPDKQVQTLDVISGRQLSSYALVAATVAVRSSSRPVTPGLAWIPAQKFDGEVVIHVVDDATGEKLAGAVGVTSMTLDGIFDWAPPFYSSASAGGVLRYPIGRTELISIEVEKEGYGKKAVRWRAGLVPDEFTFRLAPRAR